MVDVVNSEGGLLKYAVLKPAVQFDRLEEVQVLVGSRQPPAPLAPAASNAGGKSSEAFARDCLSVILLLALRKTTLAQPISFNNDIQPDFVVCFVLAAAF